MRVYELAKKFGIPNKDMIAKIRALRIDVNNHMTSLAPDDVAMIKRSLERGEQSVNSPNVIRPQEPKDVPPLGTHRGPPTIERGAGDARSRFELELQRARERAAEPSTETNVHRDRVVAQGITEKTSEPVRERGITLPTSVILDGLNIMYWSSPKAPKLGTLLTLCQELKRMRIQFICFLDGSARHKLGKQVSSVAQKSLEHVLAILPHIFSQVPARTKADTYILQRAHSDDSVVISYDIFRDDEFKQYEWLSDANRLTGGTALAGRLQVPTLGINVRLSDDVRRPRQRLDEQRRRSANALSMPSPATSCCTHDYSEGGSRRRAALCSAGVSPGRRRLVVRRASSFKRA
jgi:hypothetical protein